jgi:hypothetical protein
LQLIRLFATNQSHSFIGGAHVSTRTV